MIVAAQRVGCHHPEGWFCGVVVFDGKGERDETEQIDCPRSGLHGLNPHQLGMGIAHHFSYPLFPGYLQARRSDLFGLANSIASEPKMWYDGYGASVLCGNRTRWAMLGGEEMSSTKRAIRLIKIAALVLGGLVVALLVGAAIYISTWGPTLPPETDETIQRVLQAELPDVVQGQTGYARSGHVEIWYESIEPKATPKGTVLLIMGIGNDALAWPGYFIQPIVDAGYRVVCHDHRGTGLSDWIEDWDPEHPYTLDDMAGDGIAVLDALRVEKAHVVGISMGGMIAQQIAISYPERVVSLTSIMSSGYAQDPELPGLSAELAAELAKLGIKYGLLGTEKSTLKMFVASQQLLMGNPPYDLDIQTISEQVLYNLRVRKGYNPRASQQHQAATLASGSRYEDLARLEVPALIIHGKSDPLIPIAHGQKCAQSIPGAQTLWVEGMGHDLPRIFVDTILSEMFEHFQRAQVGSQGE